MPLTDIGGPQPWPLKDHLVKRATADLWSAEAELYNTIKGEYDAWEGRWAELKDQLDEAEEQMDIRRELLGAMQRVHGYWKMEP